MSLPSPSLSQPPLAKAQVKKGGKNIKSKEVISEDEDDTDDGDADVKAGGEDVPYPNMVRTSESGPPEFDWNAIEENEDLELWLVRIPHGVKPKHLDGLKMHLENEDSLGSFTKNNETYDARDVENAVGADEMKGLRLLLRRESEEAKGDYAMAPRGIARHLVVTQSLDLPTPAPTASPEGSERSRTRIKPIPVQPTSLLTHRFFPVGTFDESRSARDLSMTEDVEMIASSPPPTAATGFVSEQTPRKKTKKKSVPQETSEVLVEAEETEETMPKKKKKRENDEPSEPVRTPGPGADGAHVKKGRKRHKRDEAANDDLDGGEDTKKDKKRKHDTSDDIDVKYKKSKHTS